jgi:ribosome-associated protein
LAITAARTIDAKKAEHVEVLDLRGLSILADFFVLGSGFARVQIQALADAAREEMRKAGKRCRSVEGYEDSGWILLDFGDLVMHLMTEEARDYYRLERLWGDAPRVDWKPSPKQGEGD